MTAPAKNPPPFQWAWITSCCATAFAVRGATGNAPAVDVFVAPIAVAVASMAVITYETYLRIVISVASPQKIRGGRLVECQRWLTERWPAMIKINRAFDE